MCVHKGRIACVWCIGCVYANEHVVLVSKESFYIFLQYYHYLYVLYVSGVMKSRESVRDNATGLKLKRKYFFRGSIMRTHRSPAQNELAISMDHEIGQKG